MFIKLKVLSFIGLLIIASFLIHAVEFTHHHMDEFFGSSEMALNHASDKKSLGYVIGLFFILPIFLGMFLYILKNFIVINFIRFEYRVPETVHHIKLMLKEGRIQSIDYA